MPIISLKYSRTLPKNENDRISKSEIKIKAIQTALKDCREKGYLLDYLDRKEFHSMAVNDFTIKDFAESKFKEGIEKGILEGIEKGIQGMIKTCKKFGVSLSDTIKEVQEEFNLSEEEAKSKVNEYWK